MPQYDRVFRFLHWVMAILVISSIALIEIKGLLPKGHFRYEAGLIHIQIGLSIFLLVLTRIFWRTTNEIPLIFPPLNRLQKIAAGFVHVAIYFLMVALPILGILALQSKGKAVIFLGLTLPDLINEDTWLPYALSIKSYHELLGNILIGAIALHFASALFHHVLKKDNTLKRMLPMLY